MGTSLAVIDRELQLRLPVFQQVLPPSVSPQRLMRTVLMSIERLPALLDCSPQSIMSSATTAAVLGLEVDGVTGQGYLIPFKGRAVFVVGYRGFNTLGARAGYTINGEVVREGDEFEYSLGTGGFVRHKPMLTDVASRRIVAAWATGESRSRPAIVAVMSIEEILAIKDKSPGARKTDSPWNDPRVGFPAMASKTAKRRLARSMPLTVMQQAVALEDQHDLGHAAYLEPGGNLRVVGEGVAEGPTTEGTIVTEQPADILSPANSSVGEWPAFETLGKWANWSTDTFLPGADKVKAKAWNTYYQRQFMLLSSKQEEAPWDGYYNDLMKAYGAAMLR